MVESAPNSLKLRSPGVRSVATFRGAGGGDAFRSAGFPAPVAAGWIVALVAGLVAASEPEPSSAETKSTPTVAAKGAPSVEELQERLAKLEAAETKRAESEKAKKLADEKEKAEDALKPTVKWTGQLQVDSVFSTQNPASQARFGDFPDGSAFRRARIGMFGDYGPAEYRIEVDFALAGRPSFLDVYAGLHHLPGIGRIRVGHFFEPFSLERVTPNRFVTFMERALPDQPFAPARNMGIMANNTFADQRGTWGLGFFRSDSDAFGDDSGDGFEDAITGRVTWLAWYDEACRGRHLLHLGAGGSHRGANNETVRFRAQPEARVGQITATSNIPFVVDTGDVAADGFQLANLEFALVHGPLSFSGEWFVVPVHTLAPGSVTFQGWYLQASWFLTGEHRPWRRDIGTFDRLIPQRDFLTRDADGKLCRGPGAWELAARMSHLDLDSGFVRGGMATDFTLGVNWYLNRYLRVTTNWVRTWSGGSRGTDAVSDVFGFRVGWEF
jgi:phosphate-selective porin OprO/OprP